MNNIKEFNDHPLSRNDFWQITGPLCAGIILLAVIITFWERRPIVRFRSYVGRKLGLVENGAARHTLTILPLFR